MEKNLWNLTIIMVLIIPALFFDKTVTHVIIPDGEKSIAKYAFTGYDNLKSVVILDSVIYIESAAFATCKNLEEVILPTTS
jgi:hypothetical protein